MDERSVLVKVASRLSEAILLTTPEGGIWFANAAAADLLGPGQDDLLGRNLRHLADSDSAAASALRQWKRSNAVTPFVLVLRGPHGAPKACRCDGSVVLPATEQAAATLMVRITAQEEALGGFVSLNLRIAELHEEIRARKRAEATARERSEMLRITLTSIGDSVIATDSAGRITFMNAAAEEQTGWKAAEALGRPLDEVFVIVDEATRAPVESPVAKVLREGKAAGLANHTVLVRRDGSEHPIDDSGAPIRASDGELLGVVLVFRNVSERRQHERQRLEAERRKDEFLAMLAHELRNPLATMVNGVEAMRAAPPELGTDPSVLPRVVEAMERQGRHLMRLVDDLLDVNRISTGKIRLRPRQVSLRAVILAAVEACRAALEAHEIDLKLDLPPPDLAIRADEARLAQVFGNLLLNAAKFSERGGAVRVEARPEAGAIAVRVADAGAGIAPGLLPSVFDLFVQGDNSPGRTRGGLGVGLTVAKLITELHGGAIGVRSDGPGRGAEFTVRLPISQEAKEQQAEPMPESAGPRCRILVVDDNADAAHTLAQLLRMARHDVHIALGGQSALSLLPEVRPEVILLDIGMPGMDGYETARRMRVEHGSEATIIAVTGYGGEGEKARTREAGFDHHLIKPVSLELLQAVIARAKRPDPGSVASS